MNKNSWRTFQNLLVEKMLQGKARFLPSGKLQAGTRVNYRDVIEKASRSMIRFKKPERLIRMIVRIIAEQVGVTHTGVLLRNEKKNCYVLIDSKGEEGKKIPIGYIQIPFTSPLIKIF